MMCVWINEQSQGKCLPRHTQTLGRSLDPQPPAVSETLLSRWCAQQRERCWQYHGFHNAITEGSRLVYQHISSDVGLIGGCGMVIVDQVTRK